MPVTDKEKKIKGGKKGLLIAVVCSVTIVILVLAVVLVLFTMLGKEPVLLAEKWRDVESLEQISGTWKSDDGCLYEYPFELNGTTYLRYAWAESDDTEFWLSYAKSRNMSLYDLWQKRFVFLYEIYQAYYPVSDENNNQLGIKLRLESPLKDDSLPFRIISRKEFLAPKEIAEENTSFFKLKGKDFLMEEGEFSFKSNRFDSIYSDGKEYRRYVDYWRLP